VGSWPPGVLFAAIHSIPEDMTLFLEPGEYIHTIRSHR
jgi:hypothetical protein